MSPPRVAILAHSTNPRGGVVHALELGDALHRLGVDAMVHAPDETGRGFFRDTLCATATFRASPVSGGVRELVATRMADYLRHFDDPANRRFDVFHAQDGISGNALATLKERGLIQRFARTVHHIDAFADPELDATQMRAILPADRLFVVSALWRDRIAAQHGLQADIVGNGVDTARFTRERDGREPGLRERFGLGDGPIFLSIGGIEERKNSIRILEAFAQARALAPSAQLVIAGGASLLDHGAYQRRFAETLSALALPDWAVKRTGAIAQDDMPALYRIADTLVFPSVKEGFGLVVLEAMASGAPVVTSSIAPFTEYLKPDDAILCNPLDVAAIANAMVASLNEPLRAALIRNGAVVAARHGWRATAAAHLRAYERLRELTHA